MAHTTPLLTSRTLGHSQLCCWNGCAGSRSIGRIKDSSLYPITIEPYRQDCVLRSALMVKMPALSYRIPRHCTRNQHARQQPNTPQPATPQDLIGCLNCSSFFPLFEVLFWAPEWGSFFGSFFLYLHSYLFPIVFLFFPGRYSDFPYSPVFLHFFVFVFLFCFC